ncbi:hypothetical protein WN51_04598 [Melipona quadrifasciata]|uniref:Uncharacterized protein n=1 Tax=Melipona quadrifasciata TaxID=166423 RepID=A0A0N0BD80_9HYME|nr:hypothetical protein WN51_04598 [Melipona quadrifasciata]
MHMKRLTLSQQEENIENVNSTTKRILASVLDGATSIDNVDGGQPSTLNSSKALLAGFLARIRMSNRLRVYSVLGYSALDSALMLTIRCGLLIPQAFCFSLRMCTEIRSPDDDCRNLFCLRSNVFQSKIVLIINSHFSEMKKDDDYLTIEQLNRIESIVCLFDHD